MQNAIRFSTGMSFREFREEILLRQVGSLLATEPNIAIKELSFRVGFKSASAFGRAIKRASKLSPEQLRSHLIPNF